MPGFGAILPGVGAIVEGFGAIVGRFGAIVGTKTLEPGAIGANGRGINLATLGDFGGFAYAGAKVAGLAAVARRDHLP